MARSLPFLGLRVMMWSMWSNLLRNVCYLNKRKIFLKLLFSLKRKETEHHNMYKGYQQYFLEEIQYVLLLNETRIEVYSQFIGLKILFPVGASEQAVSKD